MQLRKYQKFNYKTKKDLSKLLNINDYNSKINLKKIKEFNFHFPGSFSILLHKKTVIQLLGCLHQEPKSSVDTANIINSLNPNYVMLETDPNTLNRLEKQFLEQDVKRHEMLNSPNQFKRQSNKFIEFFFPQRSLGQELIAAKKICEKKNIPLIQGDIDSNQISNKVQEKATTFEWLSQLELNLESNLQRNKVNPNEQREQVREFTQWRHRSIPNVFRIIKEEKEDQLKEVLFAECKDQVVVVCGMGHMDALEEDDDFKWIYNDRQSHQLFNDDSLVTE